jgi:uncharacterized membrane protein YhaH (DUF805 family)
MRGSVLGFDPDTNTGAISGHDGRRYDFAALDWHGKSRPRHGDLVDFLPEGSHAAQIYLVEPEYVAPGFGQFYFSPSGRVSRSQYWLRFFVPVLLIGIVLNLAELTGNPLIRMVQSVFQLIVLWPGIAVLIKRIHDRGKSGWLVWALYGPLIVAILFTIAVLIAIAAGSGGAAWGWGIIAVALWTAVVGVAIWFLVEFGCLRGTIGANRYGPDPVSH